MKSSNIILRQLAKGNQLAFKQVYDTYGESAYKLAFHILKDIKSAEEIVQDTFLEVWNKRETLDFDIDIGAYVYVICRNKSFNRLKELKRRQAFFDPLTEGLNDAVFVEDDARNIKELHETLEAIIEKLPDRQQLIFRLCRLEGFSHKEIAEKLNISVQTVKNQMVNALRFVREELRKQENDYPLTLFLLFFFI